MGAVGKTHKKSRAQGPGFVNKRNRGGGEIAVAPSCYRYGELFRAELLDVRGLLGRVHVLRDRLVGVLERALRELTERFGRLQRDAEHFLARRVHLLGIFLRELNALRPERARGFEVSDQPPN